MEKFEPLGCPVSIRTVGKWGDSTFPYVVKVKGKWSFKLKHKEPQNVFFDGRGSHGADGQGENENEPQRTSRRAHLVPQIIASVWNPHPKVKGGKLHKEERNRRL